jgi:hypothetical protein
MDSEGQTGDVERNRDDDGARASHSDSREPGGPRPPGPQFSEDDWRDVVLREGRVVLARASHQANTELRKPTTGAALTGAAVAGAAAIFGLPEAAIGAVAAFVVYRMLKRRNDDAEA